MALYTGHTDVFKPAMPGLTSWLEAGTRVSANAHINVQPSGY
ncbi:MAG TPA: hypothetical protein VFZ00_30185 [Solirubrobacter sp.]|nr:hypothetical protein [Solirubrobacter sp.]